MIFGSKNLLEGTENKNINFVLY